MELIIGNIRLDGDVTDADFIERYETAFKELGNKMLEFKTKTFSSTSEGFRAQCNAVNVCFDEIFGDGTASQVFEGRASLKEHLEAIEKIREWAENETIELNNFTNRYTQRHQASMVRTQGKPYPSNNHRKGKRH